MHRALIQGREQQFGPTLTPCRPNGTSDGFRVHLGMLGHQTKSCRHYRFPAPKLYQLCRWHLQAAMQKAPPRFAKPGLRLPVPSVLKSRSMLWQSNRDSSHLLAGCTSRTLRAERHNSDLSRILATRSGHSMNGECFKRHSTPQSFSACPMLTRLASFVTAALG